METILAAIDFSESAKLVIDKAVTLSRALNARLVFLHVIQPVPGTASEYGFNDVAARIASAAVREASQRLAHLQRHLLNRKVRVSAFHVRGVPGAAIIEHAEELEASYIVIGSHGHGALYELIVGSTASRVISEASCPVVVVPTRTNAPGETASFEFAPAAIAEELQTPAYTLR